MNTARIREFLAKRDLPWLALSFLAVFALRLPRAADAVVDLEESPAFVVAQDLAKGGVPYLTAWDHKGPFLYFLLAPVIRLFGPSVLALRLYTTAAVLATMLVVYLVAKRLGAGRAALLAPVAYGWFLSASDAFQGLASTSVHFMMLPAAIACLCYFKSIDGKRTWLFAAGTFSALAVGVDAAAGFSVAIVPIAFTLSSEERPWKDFFADAAAFAAGAAAPVAVFFAYFAAHKAVGGLLGAYAFDAAYLRAVSWRELWQKTGFFLGLAARTDVVAFLGTASAAAVLVLAARLDAPRRRSAAFLSGLAALSLAAFFWRRGFSGACFLQMGLPLSLFIAFAASLFPARVGAPPVGRAFAAALALTLAVTAGSWPAFVGRRAAAKNAAERKVADYVRVMTSPQDKIFLVGGQPVTYFFAERPVPLEYFAWFHHDVRFERILGIRQYVSETLAVDPPKYVVAADFPYTWYRRPADHLKRFMAGRYFREKFISGYSVYRRIDKRAAPALA